MAHVLPTDGCPERPDDVLVWPNHRWLFRSDLTEQEDLEDQSWDWIGVLRNNSPEHQRLLDICEFLEAREVPLLSRELFHHQALRLGTLDRWSADAERCYQLGLDVELLQSTRSFHQVARSKPAAATEEQRAQAQLLFSKHFSSYRAIASSDQVTLALASLEADKTKRRTLLEGVQQGPERETARRQLSSRKFRSTPTDFGTLRDLAAIACDREALRVERLNAVDLLKASLRAKQDQDARVAATHLYRVGILMMIHGETGPGISDGATMVSRLAGDMAGLSFSTHGRLLGAKDAVPCDLYLKSSDYRLLVKVFGETDLVFRPSNCVRQGRWLAEGEHLWVERTLPDLAGLVLDGPARFRAGQVANSRFDSALATKKVDEALMLAEYLYRICVIDQVNLDMVHRASIESDPSLLDTWMKNLARLAPTIAEVRYHSHGRVTSYLGHRPWTGAWAKFLEKQLGIRSRDFVPFEAVRTEATRWVPVC